MSHTPFHRHIRPGLACALGTAVVAISLVGCSISAQPANLASAKQIAASCPQGRQLAGRAALDVSGDRLSVAAEPGRLAPVRELAERVAVCGGHLRIEVFAGSASATAAVYDSELHAPGATENARLRRVPKMVDEVMNTVTTQLDSAAATLPRNGTDVLAQFGLSSEYVVQLGAHMGSDQARYVLALVITTDGAQTAPPSLADPGLTAPEAVELAGPVTVPNLAGADVRLTDVGKAVGRSLPTGYVDALKAFYIAVCQASQAASCAVVTDAAGR